MRIHLCLSLALLVGLGNIGFAQQTATPPARSQTSSPPAKDAKGSQRWEPRILEHEARLKANPPKPGGILFIGSSSIVRWDTEKAFGDLNVTNHGFGGSQIPDSTYYVKRLVTPVQPRLIVFYAGDNDVGTSKSEEEIAGDFFEFVAEVRKDLPEAKIAFIAIKPSIRRLAQLERIQKINKLVEDFTKADPKLEYIDIYTPGVDENGQPLKELLVADNLHLSPAGYEMWNKVVRPYLDADQK